MVLEFRPPFQLSRPKTKAEARREALRPALEALGGIPGTILEIQKLRDQQRLEGKKFKLQEEELDSQSFARKQKAAIDRVNAEIKLRTGQLGQTILQQGVGPDGRPIIEQKTIPGLPQNLEITLDEEGFPVLSDTSEKPPPVGAVGSRGVKFSPRPQGPKPPPGMRFTEGGQALEPIPGSPEAEKRRIAGEKERGLREGAIGQADRILTKVDQAIGKVGRLTAGLGASLAGIPGSKAKDLSKDIDTIKANLGFRELQEMRRNSPTGGALGQVAVQELNMLQATVASLDQSQSRQQLRRNLEEIKKHMERWKDTLGENVGRFEILSVED